MWLINESPYDQRKPETGQQLQPGAERDVKKYSKQRVSNALSMKLAIKIRGCIACHYCKREGKCVFDDEVNKLAPLFEEADGLVAAARFTTHLQIQHLRHCWTGFSHFRQDHEGRSMCRCCKKRRMLVDFRSAQ